MRAIFSYRVITIERLLATEKVRLSASGARVFCNVNGGNRIQTGFPWTWFVANDVISDLAMLAGFSMD